MSKKQNNTNLRLVEVSGQKLTTTSLIIAELFGRRHYDVMKTIQKLIDSRHITERGFSFSEYTEPGRKYAPYP